MSVSSSWKRILLAVFAVIVIWLAAVFSSERVTVWKGLYSAVQAANQVTISTAGPPLACALGPETDPSRLRALRSAVAAFEASPDQPVNVLRAAGQAYCWLGDDAKARVLFESALRVEPHDGVSALQLAALYWKAGNDPALQSVLDRHIISTTDLLSAADIYIKAGNLQPALDWCRFSVKSDPSSAQTWGCLRAVGLKHEQNGAWQAAIDIYQEALSKQEQLGAGLYHASFLFRIGNGCERLNDPQCNGKALDYYDRALADGRFYNDNEKAAAYENRADLRRSNRNTFSTDLYLADYQQAVALNPKAAGSIIMIGRIYLEEYNDPAQAEGYFRQVIALSPNNTSAYFYLGIALGQKGDWDGAVRAFQSAVDLKPDWTAAQEKLALARRQMENPVP